MTAIPSARPVQRPVRPRGGFALTGTLPLLRFSLRRDRVRLLVWIVVLAAAWLAFVSELAVLADDDQLAARAAVMSNPAMIMMTGPGYGLDDYTVGAALVQEVTLWIAAAAAILAILQTTRHTRAEEDTGRAELVRAAPVGRHAPAAAALANVAIAQVAIAAASLAILLSWGLDAPDAVALVAGIALVGLLFAGVALAMGQLAGHARTATGASLAVFVAVYALRAVGDAQRSPATGDDGTSVLAWLSPLAWVQQTRAFVELRWWPLGLLAGAVIIAFAVAALLAARRDFGAGILPERAGRAAALPWLAGPTGLAWRTQRTGLLWTTAGLGLLWLTSGTVMSSLDDMTEMLTENPLYAAVLAGEDLVAAFFAILVLLAAVGAAAWAVASVGRLSAEEQSGRTEAALAGGVSRPHWLLGHLLVTVLGLAVITVSSALLLWGGAVLSATDDSPTVPRLADVLALGAAYVPAVTVIAAFAAAAYAWLPRLAWIGWIPVGWAVIAGMFGELFELPDAALAASPLWWVPDALTGSGGAGDTVEPVPALMGLTVVALALAALAVWGFRRRGVPA